MCVPVCCLTWYIAISDLIFFSNSFIKVSSNFLVASSLVFCSFLISVSSDCNNSVHKMTYWSEVNHICDKSRGELWMHQLYYLFVFVLLHSQTFGFIFIDFIFFFLLLAPLDVRFGQNKLRRRYFLWSQFNRNYVPFMLICLIRLTLTRKEFKY